MFILVIPLLPACQSTPSDSSPETAPGESTACDCAPANLLFPYQKAADLDTVDYHEPSGLVYHPERQSLFVAGDQGHLTEIATNGALIKQKRIEKTDFEGLTLNPDNGLLYAVIEGKDSLLEIDPETLDARRNIPLDFTFENAPLVNAQQHGIEGIAFVPDADAANDGVFYLANQSLQAGGDNPSLIMKIILDSSAGIPIGRVAGYFPLPIPDLSDLAYDPTDQTLLAISDNNNTLLRLTLSGAMISVFPLPGQDQEAITLDPNGALYIGEDSGYVIRYDPTSH
jgi:uncharacterized protein YjiK